MKKQQSFTKRDVYQEVTQQVISALETGTEQFRATQKHSSMQSLSGVEFVLPEFYHAVQRI